MPDLRKLVADLKDVTEWFILGVELGVKHADLRKIESKFKDDIERCKVEMLQFWSNNCGDAPVTKLVTALENSGYRNLARQIQDNYKAVPGIHITK